MEGTSRVYGSWTERYFLYRRHFLWHFLLNVVRYQRISVQLYKFRNIQDATKLGSAFLHPLFMLEFRCVQPSFPVEGDLVIRAWDRESKQYSLVHLSLRPDGMAKPVMFRVLIWIITCTFSHWMNHQWVPLLAFCPNLLPSKWHGEESLMGTATTHQAFSGGSKGPTMADPRSATKRLLLEKWKIQRRMWDPPLERR